MILAKLFYLQGSFLFRPLRFGNCCLYDIISDYDRCNIISDNKRCNYKISQNLFEIVCVGDRERKIGYSFHKGTETLVRDRERFEIEGVRDRESTVVET